MMKIKIALLLPIVFLFQNPVSLEAATIGQTVVGKTIKTVVRLAVATRNIEKVKKRLVDKLNLIDEEDFSRRYTKFYELIKELPPDIKATYKVTPHMSREQMIKNVKSVDKKKIYGIISRIPDKTVTELFKEYILHTKKNAKR